MSFIAFLLLLGSAFLHAGWNLICKRQHPSQTFFMMVSAFGTLLIVPAPILYWTRVLHFPPVVWFMLAATGFCMAFYNVSLAGAYRKGHMSIVYPLVRSSPILVVTFVTFVLGKGHEVGNLAVAGIVLVVAGCFLLPMRMFTELRIRNYLNICCLLALMAACGTAGYTIIDDAALAQLREQPGQTLDPMRTAFLYLFFQGSFAVAWQAVGVLVMPGERRNAVRTIRTQFKTAMAVGAASFIAYGLALTAMAFVSNVSYVAAFRQLSIPVGAGFGMLLLREPRPLPRIVGVCTIVTGLVLVGIG